MNGAAEFFGGKLFDPLALLRGLKQEIKLRMERGRLIDAEP